MGGAYKPREVELTGMDHAILQALPEQGTKLGFMDLAPQVKQIVKDLNGQLPHGAPRVTGAAVSGRIRNLKRWGLVVDVPVTPVSDGKGFQITDQGKSYLSPLA